MGDPATTLAAGQAGLGLYNAWKGTPQQLGQAPPASYTAPGGTQTYNAFTGESAFVPTQSASDIQTQQLQELYRQHLYDPTGGGSAAFRTGLEGDLADLQSQLAAGQVTHFGSAEGPEYNAAGLPEEGIIGRLAFGGAPSATSSGQALVGQTLTPEQITSLESQISGIEQMLGSDFAPAVDPFGVTGEERQLQIGEQTGSLEDLLSQRAEQSYQQNLANLARRGITGGTAEFDLAERQAQEITNIGSQAALFGENLRATDEENKWRMLDAIQRGIGLRGAQELASQQAAGSYSLGQQQLQQQSAYNQQQQQYQQQQALQNTLGLAGQSLGYLMPSGGGGPQAPPGYFDNLSQITRYF